MPLNVLWVDDEYDTPQLEDLVERLEENDIDLTCVKSAAGAQQVLQERGKEFDVILRDLNILATEDAIGEHSGHGIQLSTFIAGLNYQLPQVFLTGQAERNESDKIWIESIIGKNPVYNKLNREHVLNIHQLLFKAAESGIMFRFKSRFPGVYQLYKIDFYDDPLIQPYLDYLEKKEVSSSDIVIFRKLQERLFIYLDKGGFLPPKLYTGIKDGSKIVKYLEGSEVTASDGNKYKIVKDGMVNHHIVSAMGYSYHMSSLALHAAEEVYGGLELKEYGIGFHNQSLSLLMLWSDISMYFSKWIDKTKDLDSKFTKTGKEELIKIKVFRKGNDENPFRIAKDSEGKKYFIHPRLVNERIILNSRLMVTRKKAKANSSSDYFVLAIVEILE